MTDASALSEAEANLPQVLAYDHENPTICDTFWGSHGCGRPPGHSEPCACDYIEYDEDGEVVSVEFADEPACGPPYHGPETIFFSLYGTPTPKQTLAAARGEAV